MSDGTANALADALRDRYVLERPLGRGGMATVYLARDLKHGRPVALKVLRPELASVLGAERFQREIRTAARLQHPHILSVHDSGHTAGQLWFTMPFVEGESLRERLRREGQLPLDDAVRIAAETARALDYAHRHGVIHRDIKPENILLTKDGDTLVADFGIARSTSPDAGQGLTATGLSIGTPAYMSPEQALGEREIDGRSDIYSLGCLVYELLAGAPPYTGPSAQAVIAGHIAQPVPLLHQARPDVPPAIEATVARAMAKTPSERFATAADFAEALTSPAAAAPAALLPTVPIAKQTKQPRSLVVLGGVALAVLVAGVLGLWMRHRSSTAFISPQRLAVLPFENLGDTADAYFADGVTDAVRDKLAGLPGLEVIASASSGQYRHTAKRPEQIGRELGVRYLLAGKVRWVKGTGASRVQVHPELVDVEGGAERWVEPFDAALTDVFQVQADIATRVAEALGVALRRAELQALTERPTEKLAAYDAYLRGQEISQRTSTIDVVNLRREIGFYEQATTLDSSFALGWAELARARAEIFWGGGPLPDLAEAAHQAAERAVALAPTQPEGYLALGTYFYRVARDYTKALAELTQGQQLAPANVDLLAALAYAEESLGRWDSALMHLQRAQALDPRSVIAAQRLGSALLALRRYPAALEAYEHGLSVDPTNMGLIQSKMTVYLALGDLPRAQAVIAAALDKIDSTTVIRYVSAFGITSWVLTSAQQRYLFRLTPAAFDHDVVAWGLACMKARAQRGDQAGAHVYADSVRAVLHAGLHVTPNDPPSRMLYGLALAHLGRYADAIREAEGGVTLLPITKDALDGAWMLQNLAEVYMLAGKDEAALDALERLLTVPSNLSPGWLRIDPTFALLKGNPRFERLVAGK